MNDNQKLQIMIQSAEAVVSKLNDAPEHLSHMHVWQKESYVESLAKEVLAILDTALKIAREPDGSESK